LFSELCRILVLLAICKQNHGHEKLETIVRKVCLGMNATLDGKEENHDRYDK
jgi:hypothetical protein